MLLFARFFFVSCSVSRFFFSVVSVLASKGGPKHLNVQMFEHLYFSQEIRIFQRFGPSLSGQILQLHQQCRNFPTHGKMQKQNEKNIRKTKIMKNMQNESMENMEKGEVKVKWWLPFLFFLWGCCCFPSFFGMVLLSPSSVWVVLLSLLPSFAWCSFSFASFGWFPFLSYLNINEMMQRNFTNSYKPNYVIKSKVVVALALLLWGGCCCLSPLSFWVVLLFFLVLSSSPSFGWCCLLLLLLRGAVFCAGVPFFFLTKKENLR